MHHLQETNSFSERNFFFQCTNISLTKVCSIKHRAKFNRVRIIFESYSLITRIHASKYYIATLIRSIDEKSCTIVPLAQFDIYYYTLVPLCVVFGTILNINICIGRTLFIGILLRLSNKLYYLN